MDNEMKYIDAEKLKAEIDKRYAEYRAKMKTEDFTYYEGMADALDLFEQFLESLQREQSSEDLNDEIKKFIEEYGYERGEDKLLIAIVARHFAEWQKGQDMGEWLKDRDGCFWDGVNEGKKAMKEQMLKDAVEGVAEELYNDGEPQCTVGVGTYFKPGDGVYVIPKEGKDD